MHTTINGIRFNVIDRGRMHNTVVLLIHGFPLDSRLWRAQMRELSSSIRVVAPDLRGHGRSQVTPGPLTMDQHADDLVALLDSLGVDRAFVAGLSMGGYVAFAFWRRYPERVQGLILVDTRAEPDSAAARANRDASASRVQQSGAAALADEMLPRLLAPASLSRASLVAAVRNMIGGQPVVGIVGALAGVRDRADSRPILPTITVPTLVVVGAEDAITPPSDAAALAAGIPGARLVTIPGAGHLSPLENPRAFDASVREFVKSAAQIR